jgi:uncharacterized protein (DUF2237 family)
MRRQKQEAERVSWSVLLQGWKPADQREVQPACASAWREAAVMGVAELVVGNLVDTRHSTRL